MEIREMTEADAAAWWHIRLEALENDPAAFGSDASEHRTTTVESAAERLRASSDRNFTLGAFEDGRLIGTAVFVRAGKVKEQHKGYIYAVYVTPAHRGKGIARALIAILLDRVKKDPTLEQIQLGVSSTQPAALRLYTSFGFEPFGQEPRGHKIGLEYIDVHHMLLRL